MDKFCFYYPLVSESDRRGIFDYNYRQPHKSLRQDLTGEAQKFKRRYQHLTPAMKMGLTSTQLEWRDLILAPIPENAHEFPTSTVL